MSIEVYASFFQSRTFASRSFMLSLFRSIALSMVRTLVVSQSHNFAVSLFRPFVVVHTNLNENGIINFINYTT